MSDAHDDDPTTERNAQVGAAAGVLAAFSTLTFDDALAAIHVCAGRLNVGPEDVAAFVEYRGQLPR